MSKIGPALFITLLILSLVPVSAMAGNLDGRGVSGIFGTVNSPSPRPVMASPGTFSRADALTLATGEDFLRAAVIDVAAGFAYFGTYTQPGQIVKIRLSDFSRVAVLPLNPGEDFLRSAVIDPAAGFAYFGTDTSPGYVVRINLNTFSHAGTLSLPAGEDQLASAVIDPAAGYAYFGTYTSPGQVVRVRLGTFTHAGTLSLPAGEDYLTSAVIDSAAGFAYFGTNTFPGRVVKIRLSDFTRVDAVTLSGGENFLESAVIDSAAGFAYFGTNTFPGRVVKVRLSDMTRIGEVLLQPGEDRLFTAVASAVLDPVTGCAYFGASTAPGKVVQVQLSDLTRVDALTLNSGEDLLRAAIIDDVAGFIYFGTFTSPGIVIKINVGQADLSLTKTVDEAAPNVGDDVTFTVTLNNAGPNPATNVQVKDVLPAGLAFISAAPSQGTYDQVSGIWDLVDPIPVAGTATLDVVAQVTGPGAAENIAEVTASDQFDPDSTPNNSAPAEDDQDSVTVTPQQADLSLTKTVDNNIPLVAMDVRFTITVSNAGPDAATHVEVTDHLPAGLTFITATPTQGSYDPVSGVWTVGSLPANASASLEIAAQVAIGTLGTMQNTAEVTASDQFDPNSIPGNNEATEDDRGTVTVTVRVTPFPVGGYGEPADPLVLLAPWLALLATAAGVLLTLVELRRRGVL